MAKEAIVSVKEAEEQVREMIEEAVQASKRSKAEAIQGGEEEYRKIVNEAEESARIIKEKALKEGEAASKPILENGISEASQIIDISDEKIDKAVNIIIERIVNANGNS